MGAIITVICNFIHKICSNQNSVLLKKKNIINFEEEQYLGIIKKLLKEEKLGSGRDGTKTLSTFGVQMRFSLENGSFPLLTTKKMFFRGIFEELLWIIRGCTDSKDLENKNVNIWKKNGSRENLDKLNFINREEGDLGPIYGFQWRHFGDHYTTCKDKYVGGIDQLHNCINLIKTDPSSRRIIISAWNPLDIEKMVLPPCHVLYQFHVKNGELSCSLYQRSGDMGLGVPFNIASASLLTIIIAKHCNLKPKELVHFIGDCHIYDNQIEQLKVQCSRKAFNFPKISLSLKTSKIEDINYDDIMLINYKHHDSLNMEMKL